MASPSTRNLTILLTDIKGFTEKTSRKSRSEVLAMLEKHKEIVLPVLENRGGKLIKTIGDAFLMVFESPTDAVLSGVEVQEALLAYNEGKTGDDRLDVRIAINVGEVNLTDDDVFGEPVNITARIEAIAEAGEVYFSEVAEPAKKKREVPTSEIGFRKLKGIADEIKLYKVKREIPVEALPAERIDDEPDAPKTKETLPPPVMPLERPTPLWRRGGALVIDFLLCSLIFNTFFDASGHERASRADHRRAEQKLKQKLAKSGVHIEENRVRIGGVELSNKGIHGKDLSVDENGVRFEGGIQITEDRVKIGNAVDIKVKKSPDSDAGGNVEEAAVDLEQAVEDVFESEPPRSRPPSRKPAFPLLWFLYGTFFLTIWSATPGKRILGLRVVPSDAPVAAPLDWKMSALRSLVSVFSGVMLMIGYLWGVFTKDQRTWHDLIAKTRVVRD